MITSHPSNPNESAGSQDEESTVISNTGTGAGTHSQVHWQLRELMARRNHMTQAELVRALEEDGTHVITRTQVWRLATKVPAKISLDLIGALCRILRCTPNDLLGWEAPPTAQDLNPTLTRIAEQGRQHLGAEAVPPVPTLPSGAPRLDEQERARIVGPPARTFQVRPLGGKPK